MAKVLHLFYAPMRGTPMQEVEEIPAVENFGFAGCGHARRESGRQVLLMDRETLDVLALAPGVTQENITTEGIDVNGLQTGQQLKIGEALLEVSGPCTPCGLMEKIRPGLRKEIRGRRGVLCRVKAGGRIRRGDLLQKLS